MQKEHRQKLKEEFEEYWKEEVEEMYLALLHNSLTPEQIRELRLNVYFAFKAGFEVWLKDE